MRRRAPRSSSLRVRSLKAALGEFLSAPATGGYGTNDGVVQAVMGSKGKALKDCPTFDNVRAKYDKPKACTFESAFNACWAGSRDWRDFDLVALRESHPDFVHLQLPLRVEDALEREAIQAEQEHLAGDVEPEVLEEYPPLELLYRETGGRRRRGRRRRARQRCGRFRTCSGAGRALSRCKVRRR